MGRPSGLTPELTGRLVPLLRAGVAVEAATRAVRISERTFYEWMQRGERGSQRNAPYRDFRAAVEQARGEHEAILVGQLARAASKGSWRAAAWLLERSFPERWGPPEQRGAPGPAPRVPDELAALRERARRGGDT